MKGERMPADWDAWKADRKATLEAENGWLNLIARIHLPVGTHSIGSGPECDLQLSTGPDHLGEVTRTEGSVTLTPTGGTQMSFEPVPDGFPQLKLGALIFEFHDPGGDPALRVRDLTQPGAVSLDYFPFDPAWIVTADWVLLPQPEKIGIGQKGGSDTEVALTHEARFRWQGHDIRLLPTHWKSGKPMFVIRDGTSGTKTYGASRFLIAEPASGGQIELDFNRAHNPPCAFTEFAICPLPPASNILPFELTVGELLPESG